MRCRADRLATFALALAALALAALCLVPRAGRAESAAEAAAVIDGDTLQLDGRIIQLFGIDAPELGQRCRHDGVLVPCGLHAAFELRKLIGLEHAPVHCMPAPEHEDDEGLICFAGELDVAHVLLKSGYVVATTDTSEAYREAQDSAQRARLGLWHSQFVMPEEWRGGHRLPDEIGDDPCPVKGGIAGGGERYYYVPTDESYPAVSVDAAKGERLFCSDEEARQAGWRRVGQAPAGPARG